MKFLTILLICILTGAEVDLFVPSFPQLQQVFHLTPFMVELTMGVNLVAYCVVSLIAGNLGDRYGRKSIIQIGLGIFLVGSIFCIFAQSFWQLLLGRFLQGVGISGPVVLSWVVLLDDCPLGEQQTLIGKLNGFITAAMAGAPIVGSYVTYYFHWQGNFWILFILGLTSFLMGAAFIPKNLPNKNISISLREYLPLLTSKKAIYHIIVICFMVLSYWTFIGISPILYIKDMGVPLTQFGYYQGALALTFSLFSIYFGYFLKKFGEKNCFYFGLSTIVFFIVLTFIFIIFGVSNPLAITLAMMILSIGVIFPINILIPYSMNVIEGAKGRMSGLFNSGRVLLTSISLQLVGYFYQGTFLSIGILMCIALIITLFACYKLLQVEQLFTGEHAAEK